MTRACDNVRVGRETGCSKVQSGARTVGASVVPAFVLGSAFRESASYLVGMESTAVWLSLAS
jgi:hypothetical protein